MSKKDLENLFTSISGTDFVKKLDDEKKAKEIAEEKKIKAENDKQEKQKLDEQQKLQVLENIFGVPKFEQEVKKEIKKEKEKIISVDTVEKKPVNEKKLLETLGGLFASVDNYKKQKAKEDFTKLEEELITLGKDNSIMSSYLNTLDKVNKSEDLNVNYKPIEPDINQILQSKTQTAKINDKNVIKDINHILDERNVRPYEKKNIGDNINPMSEYVDRDHLHKILKVNKPENLPVSHKPIEQDINQILQSKTKEKVNIENVIQDISNIFDEKNVKPFMETNVGKDIKPMAEFVDREQLYKLLTDQAKSLTEQIDGGEMSLADVVQEFQKFKKLTTLQLQSVGGGGAANLVDLSDVDTSTQQNGYALKYNSTTGKYDFGEVAADLTSVDSNIIPDTNATRDIGSSSKKFNNAFFKNLTVDGTLTTISSTNTVVADQLFELGNGRTGSASGDSGIIIERGSDANIFLGYDESSDEVAFATTTGTGASTGDLSLTNANIRAANVTSSGNLDVSGTTTLRGNVTIGVNSGDSTEDTITVTGRFISNLEPLTNVLYDLGSPQRRWRDIYLSGNTIDLAGATISGDGTGAITISATGATLPAGSKIGTKKIAQSDAGGTTTKDVPFFTAAGGLSSANTTFTMAAGSSRASVFTDFTKADGTQQSRFELFSF